MALEYRLTLAGTISMSDVVARAFPADAAAFAPAMEGTLLTADLKELHGFVATVMADTDGYYMAATETGPWEWEPATCVDLLMEMTRDADRLPSALRSAIAAAGRVLDSGDEDAALMLGGDQLLLARVNGVIAKDARDWWEHYAWANDIIPG